MSQNNILEYKVAAQMSQLIAQQSISIAKLQFENEKLSEKNSELQMQVANLRKKVDANESGIHNSANKQNRNKDK